MIKKKDIYDKLVHALSIFIDEIETKAKNNLLDDNVFSEDFINELRYKNPIEEVISSYVVLKRTGSTLTVQSLYIFFTTCAARSQHFHSRAIFRKCCATAYPSALTVEMFCV